MITRSFNTKPEINSKYYQKNTIQQNNTHQTEPRQNSSYKYNGRYFIYINMRSGTDADISENNK